LPIGHQPVRVELERGGQHLSIDGTLRGAPARCRSVRWVLCAQESGSVGSGVKPSRRFAERNALDLLDESDCVTARVTSETNPSPRAGIRRQVGASMVAVEWTSARECTAGAAKLDPVLSNDVDDRVLLKQEVSVDASPDGHHRGSTHQSKMPNGDPPADVTYELGAERLHPEGAWSKASAGNLQRRFCERVSPPQPSDS
jgi:hypothetical protein